MRPLLQRHKELAPRNSISCSCGRRQGHGWSATPACTASAAVCSAEPAPNSLLPTCQSNLCRVGPVRSLPHCGGWARGLVISPSLRQMPVACDMSGLGQPATSALGQPQAQPYSGSGRRLRTAWDVTAGDYHAHHRHKDGHEAGLRMGLGCAGGKGPWNATWHGHTSSVGRPRFERRGEGALGAMATLQATAALAASPPLPPSSRPWLTSTATVACMERAPAAVARKSVSVNTPATAQARAHVHGACMGLAWGLFS